MRAFRFLLLLFLLVSIAEFSLAEETRPVRFTGVLALKDGRPLQGGLIYLFNKASGPPPIMERYWRIPDLIAELDENGRFDLELSAGTYYLASVKHFDPKDVGPPKKGEIIMLSRDAKGEPAAYSLASGETRDIGTLAEAVPFDPAMLQAGSKGITAIEGRIVGEDGKPIAGVPVFAFTTPATVGRPLFASERSDSDGKFLLRVHGGGTYYLKVRGKYGGGQPGQDSVLDGEKDEQLASVTVATGEISKGVLHKAFTVRGPKSKRKGKMYDKLKNSAEQVPSTQDNGTLMKH